MTRDVEVIRSELQQERSELVRAAGALRGEVRQTFDLRARLRARPLLAIAGGALAALVVLRSVRSALAAAVALAAEIPRAAERVVRRGRPFLH